MRQSAAAPRTTPPIKLGITNSITQRPLPGQFAAIAPSTRQRTGDERGRAGGVGDNARFARTERAG